MIPNLNSLKRVIVARKDINIDDVLSEENISIMRVKDCNQGINPMRFSEVLGCKTKKNIKKFQILKIKDLKI